MRRVVFAILSVLIGLCQAAAQQPLTPEECASGTHAAFDVVSVKPSQTPSTSTSMRSTPDGLVYTGTLQRLALIAFNVHDFQVTGGPGWFSTATWEIRAKSDAPDPPAAQLSDLQRHELWDKHMQELRSVLVERFQFRCHVGAKEMPVYELEVSKGGSKLTETKAERGNRGSMSTEGYGIVERASATGVGTDRIAIFLARPTGRLVVDKTGLTGSYDFTLSWMGDAPPGAETGNNAPTGPTIFTAVEEQLGLHLRPAKAQVPVMVIDRVEMPTEN